MHRACLLFGSVVYRADVLSTSEAGKQETCMDKVMAKPL